MSTLSGLQDFWNEFNALGREVDYFVTARLFDGTPAVWPGELSYVRWRHMVATSIDVDPMGVQLVGSARLGYSLNPKKNFKRFDQESDLDIAVVSPELFDTAWSELQEIIRLQHFEGRKGQIRTLVFDECIALDVVLAHLSFGKVWSQARDIFVGELGGGFLDRTVNYRLYRNHKSLRKYQQKSVQKARDRAIEEEIGRA